MFVHAQSRSCVQLSATRMGCSPPGSSERRICGKWIHKLWSPQTMEYHSTLERNELPSHEKTRRNQCISLSERSQTQKSTNSTIPTMQYARKCRTMKTAKKKKISGFQRLGVGERMNRETIEDFSRAVRYYDDGYICPNPQNTQKQE